MRGSQAVIGFPRGVYMQGWSRRALGASFAAAAVLGLAPAAHAAVNVTQISSLAAGAQAGNLSGLVDNDGKAAAKANVVVRMMRYGSGGRVVVRTSVDGAARCSQGFLVNWRIPAGAKRGTYYLAACTPQGGSDKGRLGCATAQRDVLVKGGDPLRGIAAQKQF